MNPGYFDYDLFDRRRGLVHYGADASDYSTRVFTRRAEQLHRTEDRREALVPLPGVHLPHGPPVHDPDGRRTPHPASPTRCRRTSARRTSPTSRRSSAASRLAPTTQAQFNSRMRAQQAKMLAVGGPRAWGRSSPTSRPAGRCDNTLILFISDNGVPHGQPPHQRQGAALRGVRPRPADDALGRLWGAAPRSIDAFALNIDLAPTITDAAGVTQHNPYDGTSLLPMLQGSATTGREDFLLEHLTRSARATPAVRRTARCATGGSSTSSTPPGSGSSTTWSAIRPSSPAGTAFRPSTDHEASQAPDAAAVPTLPPGWNPRPRSRDRATCRPRARARRPSHLVAALRSRHACATRRRRGRRSRTTASRPKNHHCRP